MVWKICTGEIIQYRFGKRCAAGFEERNEGF